MKKGNSTIEKKTKKEKSQLTIDTPINERFTEEEISFITNSIDKYLINSMVFSKIYETNFKKNVNNTYCYNTCNNDPINAIETDDELDDEDILNNIVNNYLRNINSKILQSIKEAEITKPETELEKIKIKPTKYKNIKILKSIFKKIRTHCQEYNIDVEKWIEKISINEIDRIIHRVGDIDYKKEKTTNEIDIIINKINEIK